MSQLKWIGIYLLFCLICLPCRLNARLDRETLFEQQIVAWNTVITDRNRPAMDSFYTLLQSVIKKGSSTSDSLRFYHSLGAHQNAVGLPEESLNSLYLAVKLAKDAKEPAKEAQIQLSIGVAQYGLKNIDDALKSFEAVKRVNNAKLSTKTAACNNIAALNYEWYTLSKDKVYQDSLLPIINSNYWQAISMAKLDSNMQQLSSVYSVMIPWYAIRGKFDSAYYYAREGIRICEENDYAGRIAFIKINISKAKIWEGKAAASIPLLDSAIHYFTVNDIPDQIIHAWRIKSMAYDSLGMHDSAYALAHRMFYKQRDNFNDKMAKSVGENRAKFQTNLKELENQKLIVENKNKQLKANRLITIALLLSALVIGLFLYFRNRLKRKQIELQEQELVFKTKLIKSNMESEEKERRRIARELHDGIGQQISSVKLGLEHIHAKQKEEVEQMNELNQMVNVVMDNVRDLSHQMMPVALERLGLVAALESLVETVNKNSTIQFEFAALGNDKKDLEPFVKTQYYRIAQELIQNVIKHSKASEATLTLIGRVDKLVLMVSDNGKGMEDQLEKMGMGMLNMHSRANAIGASLKVSSDNGETNIRLELKTGN